MRLVALLALALLFAAPLARADPSPRSIYGCYTMPTLVVCAWGDWGSETPTRTSVTEFGEAGNRGVADAAIFLHLDSDGGGDTIPRIVEAFGQGTVYADGLVFAVPFLFGAQDTNGDRVPDKVWFLDPVVPILIP